MMMEMAWFASVWPMMVHWAAEVVAAVVAALVSFCAPNDSVCYEAKERDREEKQHENQNQNEKRPNKQTGKEEQARTDKNNNRAYDAHVPR
jgi:mannitol-specific phosphotransferase system IIBC component